jgi:hypothetical protein
MTYLRWKKVCALISTLEIGHFLSLVKGLCTSRIARGHGILKNETKTDFHRRDRRGRRVFYEFLYDLGSESLAWATPRVAPTISPPD